MGVRQDEPFEIQPRANGAMATVLLASTTTALVLALAGSLLPGAGGRAAAWAAVGSVVTVPLGRVAWLAVRWVQRRDLRYAAIAFALLGLVLASGVAAVVLAP